MAILFSLACFCTSSIEVPTMRRHRRRRVRLSSTIVSSHVMTVSSVSATLANSSERARYAVSSLATQPFPLIQFCKLNTFRGLAVSRLRIRWFLSINASVLLTIVVFLQGGACTDRSQQVHHRFPIEPISFPHYCRFDCFQDAKG